jgi:putrescine transport system substrate-binding protein
MYKKIIFFSFLFFTNYAFAQENVLNVYNWADYINKEAIEQFSNETGIKVNYDVFDSNYTLEAKITTADSGYDIVFPSASPFLARQLEAGLYQKIDKTKLKNYKNLDTRFLKILSKIDTNNNYAIPYLWGSFGLGYNGKQADNLFPNMKIDSYRFFFDQDYVKKFSHCGVGLVDEEYIIMPIVTNYLVSQGISAPNTEDINSLLSSIRPLISNISEAIYADNLADNNACLVIGSSGDIMQAKYRAKETNNGIEVKYSLPKEGSVISIETMVIPKTAKNIDNAYKFIDFLLRPEIISRISLITGYQSPNKESYKLLPKDIIEDKNLYPDDETLNKLILSEPLPKDQKRERVRNWLRFITNKY